MINNGRPRGLRVGGRVIRKLCKGFHFCSNRFQHTESSGWKDAWNSKRGRHKPRLKDCRSEFISGGIGRPYEKIQRGRMAIIARTGSGSPL